MFVASNNFHDYFFKNSFGFVQKFEQNVCAMVERSHMHSIISDQNSARGRTSINFQLEFYSEGLIYGP